jgi:hypothetical protein
MTTIGGDPYGTYHGYFDPDGIARITWTPDAGSPEPVSHVVEHSPDGLNWGYNGRGPADTALSVLHHATGNPELADTLHQQLKRDIVATLELNQPFELAGQRVANWLHAHGVETSQLVRDQSHLEPDPIDADSLHAGHEPQEFTIEANEEGLQGEWEQLRRRQHELDQQEARLKTHAAALRAAIDVEPAWSLPAQPVVAQIRSLQQGTGDPLETIAAGLDIEPQWAQNLLDGKIRNIDLDHIHRLCAALHCSPYDMWGAEDARTILHSYGPELWPPFIEPLQPEPLQPEHPPVRRRDLDPPTGPGLDR